MYKGCMYANLCVRTRFVIRISLLFCLQQIISKYLSLRVQIDGLFFLTECEGSKQTKFDFCVSPFLHLFGRFFLHNGFICFFNLFESVIAQFL